MRSSALSFGLASVVLLCLMARPIGAQGTTDVFASQDNYWNGKRRDFPECSNLIDRHEALTRELYDLDAQARRAVEPQRRELVRQLNEKARERSQVQRDLDACTRQAIVSKRPGSNVLDGRVEYREPDLALERARRNQVFQLSAQVTAARRSLGKATDEFLKGVLDWAKSTLDFLAQKPGEPLNQMAEGIVKYLTNDNAANHAQLRGQAEEAVRQFQANPARFMGQLVPNLVPLPKVQALSQLARVEAGASRALAVAANEQRFTRAYNGAIARSEQRAARGGFGISTPADACLAQNACFPTAIAQDILWRSEEPFVIQGVQATAANDMRTTAADAMAILQKHNDPGFMPRRADLYTGEQLTSIWMGEPIPATLEQMTDWLRLNGEGSQALVFAEVKKSLVPATAPGGHVLNMRFHNGAIEVLDRTNFKLNVADVEQWWFFPTK